MSKTLKFFYDVFDPYACRASTKLRVVVERSGCRIFGDGRSDSIEKGIAA